MKDINKDDLNIDLKYLLSAIINNRRFLYLISILYFIFFGVYFFLQKVKFDGRFLMFIPSIKDELVIDDFNKTEISTIKKIYNKCFFSYTTSDIYFLLKSYEENLKERSIINLHLPRSSNIIIGSFSSYSREETLETLNNASSEHINYLKSISIDCIKNNFDNKGGKIDSLISKDNIPIPANIISKPEITEINASNLRDEFFIFLFLLNALGSVILIIKERVQGNLYNIDEFKKLIKYQLIGNLYGKNSKLNYELIKNFLKTKNKDLTKSRLILITDTKKTKLAGKLKNKIFRDVKAKDFLFINNINSLYEIINTNDSDENFIIIFVSGTITAKNLKIFSDTLLLKDEKILGWCFFDSYLYSSFT